MELSKWEIFQHLDPAFAADVKRAYLVGISSFENDSDDGDEDTERESAVSIMRDEFEKSEYAGGVVIMKNDDVYFITRNYSELPPPLMNYPDDLLPLVPIKIDALCGQQIRAISSGYNHVVALTVEGRIFQWGYVYIENAEEPNIEFKPEFATGDGIENKRVIQIACGQDHTVALTSEGDVYTWGSNSFGQLGTGRNTNEKSPTKISGLKGFDAKIKISMVTCSGWSSFALDKDGTVWSWGDNQEKVLGYDSNGPQKFPLKIIRLKNIKTIAAGNTHALALSDKGELYFWGQHGSEGTTVAPKKIEIPNVAFIGAIRGCGISALQTTKRKVYFWGFGCGHFIPEPAPTKFSTIAEVFASLDSPVMFEPVILDLKQAITEKLKLNFDDKDTADISFSVEGRIIYAHRAVLRSRSNHFKRMFGNNWREGDEKQLEIEEFPYQGFHAFLFYLYTNRIDPAIRTAEDAIELLRLSDYYGEEDLKQRCERLLKILITEDNVSKAYTVACRYNANDLHELALDFIVPNLNNIVMTDEFGKMPDDLKMRLLQELAKEDVLVGLKRRRNTQAS